MKYDYIIVGGGIAGTVLALTLLEKDQKVLVIDQPKADSSSKVAAGIFNPVTGKRSVLTWKANLLFPYLHQFYTRWQNNLNARFLFRKNIYKPFSNIIEQNDLMGKSADEAYKPFIHSIVNHSLFPEWLHNPFGGIIFQNSGYLEVKTFLKYAHTYLHKKNILQSGIFDPDLLILNSERINYAGIKAKKLIFCEGTEVLQNPFFRWLPLDPVKGELLEINSGIQLEWDFIVNRDMFLLPTSKGNFLAGATYDKSNLDSKPTEVGKQYIIDKLRRFYKPEFRVVNQWAGVRPATRDRRPLLGFHPEKKLLAVFNGFGTKGVSLAPYFANQMAEALILKKEFDKEVNISRF
ncbi:MAG: NAD(P)/FAD-dependent oxidoreductase [Cyclobacteriaceae bacterium]